jgi:hypothetical protein
MAHPINVIAYYFSRNDNRANGGVSVTDLGVVNINPYQIKGD